MRLKARRLNTTVAALFMIGAAGFALGCLSFYATAVGATGDAVTFFVASLFFTAASFGQLVQSQSPAMAATWSIADDRRQPVRLFAWLPRDKAWLAAAIQFPGTICFNATTLRAIFTATDSSAYDKVVWRPDFYGSILFLVSSAFALLALGRVFMWRPRAGEWWIAWLNMVGSVAFMASAIGAFVLPKTGDAVDLKIADRGTLLGAVCFFVGAWLMVPVWRRAAGAARRRGGAV